MSELQDAAEIVEGDVTAEVAQPADECLRADDVGDGRRLGFMIDQYYAKEPMTKLDKAVFAFASYNAGPARIQRLRHEAAGRGLDPNVWFGNVEHVVADKIGRETVTYVSNIYKYYIAYQLIIESQEARKAAREQIKGDKK